MSSIILNKFDGCDLLDQFAWVVLFADIEQHAQTYARDEGDVEIYADLVLIGLN